jgi:hypothetical protein
MSNEERDGVRDRGMSKEEGVEIKKRWTTQGIEQGERNAKRMIARRNSNQNWNKNVLLLKNTSKEDISFHKHSISKTNQNPVQYTSQKS